jgi:hypothetical protein
MGVSRQVPFALVALATLLTCALPCAVARADAPKEAAPPPDPAPGGLDPGLVARAPTVLLGRVAWVRPGIGGAQHLSRVDVERTIRGRVPGRSVTLFLAGPPPEADARQRGRLEGQVGRRFVLFLSPTRGGSGHQVEALFSAEDAVGAEKAAFLAAEFAPAEGSAGDARARRVSRLLEALARGGAWTRAQAAALLRLLADADASSFPESAHAELRSALSRAADPASRAHLAAVLERLAPPADGGGKAGGAASRLRRHFREAEGDDARCLALTSLAREAKGEALGDLLAAAADPSPRVRERAAVLAGDVAPERALSALLDRFASEEDPAVREAIVRAVGLARGFESVPWLVERERHDATRRAALYALARVGGPDADAALAAARVAALSRVPPDRASASLVDYLRGPAFEEAERAAGRIRPPPAPRPPGSEEEAR